MMPVSPQVKVTMREGNNRDEKFIRNLFKGDFFGEKALRGYVGTGITREFHIMYGPHSMGYYFTEKKSGQPTSLRMTLKV